MAATLTVTELAKSLLQEDFDEDFQPTVEHVADERYGRLSDALELEYITRNGCFIHLFENRQADPRIIMVTLGYRFPFTFYGNEDKLCIEDKDPAVSRFTKLDLFNTLDDSKLKSFFNGLLYNPIHQQVDRLVGTCFEDYLKEGRRKFFDFFKEINGKSALDATKEAVGYFEIEASKYDLIAPGEYAILQAAHQAAFRDPISYNQWHQKVDRFAPIAHDYFNLMLYLRLGRYNVPEKEK